MLVKIIAAGLAPPIWKNVFQELRALLHEQPFSVGMFAAREELAFLMEEFYPRQWQRESPDFLLWDGAAQDDWEAQRPFLAGVGQLAAPLPWPWPAKGWNARSRRCWPSTANSPSIWTRRPHLP